MTAAPATDRPSIWTSGWTVLAALGVVLACLSPIFPHRGDSNARLSCMNNLSQLGQIYVTEATGRGGAPPRHGGSGLWLSYRRGARQIQRGSERVLVCPNDPLAHAPETAEEHAAYDGVDLAHAPRALCSYAARDFERFPLDQMAMANEVIGACLSHKGGAVVLYQGGDVTWRSLDELGLSSDDEKTVGPDSKSPALRLVRYGDGSVR